jgi:hypothetical protein
MCIKFCWKMKSIFLLAIIFTLGTGCRLWATTVEVENEDDDISVVPTPMPKTSNPQVKPQNDETMDADLKIDAESKAALPSPTRTPVMNPTPLKKTLLFETPIPTTVSTANPVISETLANSPGSFRERVRISDKVGFYYFVSAGFLVSDSSQVHSIGKVIGNADYDLNFSTPQKTYIELSSDQYNIKPDDLLLVFRTVVPIHIPHSAGSGYVVENLAIVKVVEIQKKRVLVEVKESFAPLKDGDRVESYDGEIKRWKQAQIKKELPSHSVKCFVLGGDVSRKNYEQTDFIYLSVGTKSGVVEGQKFEIREIKSTGAMEEPIHALRGVAQVIFSGLNYSTAQIIKNSESIQKGFEAIYQP